MVLARAHMHCPFSNLGCSKDSSVLSPSFRNITLPPGFPDTFSPPNDMQLSLHWSQIAAVPTHGLISLISRETHAGLLVKCFSWASQIPTLIFHHCVMITLQLGLLQHDLTFVVMQLC